MKNELSAFDLMVLAKEFQSLVDAYIDNLYQPRKDELMLKLSSKKLDRRFLRIRVGKWIWLEKECDERIQDQFSNALKKYISNGKIGSVEQLGFERLLRFVIKKKEGFELNLEFVPPGNIILVRNGLVLKALTERKWKDREIKAGQPYRLPPSRVDVPSLKRSGFVSILRSSQKDLVRALALDLNLGGLYAEELCLRAGLDKKKAAALLTDEELGSAHRAFREIIGELTFKASPSVVFKNGEVFDVTPIGLRVYSGMEAREFKSFIEALACYLSETEEEGEAAKDEERERICRIIQSQKEADAKWEAEIRKSHRAAELIYEHYREIEDILNQLRTDPTYTSSNLTSRDLTKKTAILSFNGEQVVIAVDKNVHENAQVYYERIKKAKSKLEAVKQALRESEKELERTARKTERKKFEEALPPRRTRRFWFESYRWFVSSEGFLVIGGRDAKGNEAIFRKHLKPGDRYVHAEISGAPSVVVKEGSKASEETLKEACQFSAAHSRAWRLKLASGNAYWVNPEQVSRTPEAGEYLKKGSFVIRGKRNHLRNLELKLALGEVEHEGQRLIMCAPLPAMEKISKRYVVFRPGGIDKNRFARELGRDFNARPDDIMPLLPPGDVEVLEKRGF